MSREGQLWIWVREPNPQPLAVFYIVGRGPEGCWTILTVNDHNAGLWEGLTEQDLLKQTYCGIGIRRLA